MSHIPHEVGLQERERGVSNHEMSFGASPPDVIVVVRFCRALYRKCEDTGGEYDEISREVRGMHI